jgi:hypothetical protein
LGIELSKFDGTEWLMSWFCCLEMMAGVGNVGMKSHDIFDVKIIYESKNVG